ncbi:MAG: glycerate kinase [Opitutales bacterium]|nr:glycerate kinase [Opitutales bacterium]
MRALVAFDKFKDALTASHACEIACSVLRNQRGSLDCQVDSAPLTDGGEGFCEILTTVAKGRFEELEVEGPRGEPTEVRLGFAQADKLSSLALKTADLPRHGEIAVIEMAAAAGLHLLSEKERDPWEASTHGVGEMILRANEEGAGAILLGIGGSATNDLGFGALQALGLQFINSSGSPIERLRPSNWNRLDRIEGHLTDLSPLRIACDVQNPLLGTSGATATYGPQKGLLQQDLERAEEELVRSARLLLEANGADQALFDEPGAGAAGGLGFGFRTAAKASYVSGFSLVSAWLGLEKRVEQADVVITGEGRFDFSSLRGKGPGAVAEMAAKAGKSVLILAGSVAPEAVEELTATCPGIVVRAISRPDLSLEENLRQAPERLAKGLQEVIEAGNWNL